MQNAERRLWDSDLGDGMRKEKTIITIKSKNSMAKKFKIEDIDVLSNSKGSE